MAWIWEREEWPHMAGVLEPQTAMTLKLGWKALKERLSTLPPQAEAMLRNRIAGLEAAGSQAIENIHVSSVFCEMAQFQIGNGNDSVAAPDAEDEFGGLDLDPETGLDLDPETIRAIFKIMRDQTRASMPIYGAGELKEAMSGWHRDLMGYGVNNPCVEPGKFRARRVGVGDGIKMVYIAPPPSALPAEMENFFAAYDSYGTENMDVAEAAIMSAMLHLQLVVIHPYGDGNGRSARFLALQGLSRMDGFGSVKGPAFPLSNAIFSKRWEYYKALQKIQSFNRKNGKIDVSPWLEWHAGIICNAMEYTLNEIRLIRSYY